MARRKPRPESQTKRRGPKREPYDRVLIVCEGEKTEPYYFNELKDHYRLSTANISVTPASGSDPLSIVHTAKSIKADATRQRNPYDRVYCVFDRDEHANFEAACQQMADARLDSARSWPCFEVWLLLHFRYSREPLARSGRRSPADNCIRTLREQRGMEDYQKARRGLFAKLLPRLEADAKVNAERSRRDACTDGEDNPSTEVHTLVAYLQQLKDPT
jgi:hypothetical protein